MITRTQIIPLLLEACPSFGNVWGPIQRPGEDEDPIIYVAFGAFAGHLGSLRRKDRTGELSAVGDTSDRFRAEGDPEVKRLATELIESIGRQVSGENPD